ncbi:sortase domain-containing protein [Nocardioides ochotonae]|uniref:sortase domain-containing protein n=1 Tax=Nocardioides ochotonae TaxID=2685869 RepID=UPI001A9EC5D4
MLLVSACSAGGGGGGASPRGAAEEPIPAAPVVATWPAAAGQVLELAVSDGRPARALLSVPALGIADLAVVPYRGVTDDAPGTAIQDGGVAASPHGPGGGTGPGGVGNFQVTAHRVSSTRAFEHLPSLGHGSRVLVDVGETRYVYEVRATRRTSFRSAQSLREQRAAVPGRPGATPRRAMLTLSTCATPEDHAAGNWWSDEHGNPEHRIDKVAVLVEVEVGERAENRL